jgi:hypothetical protein
MNEITTDLFWDCDCDDDYIHTKTQMECPVCKVTQEDAPDSMKDEVIDFLCLLLNFLTRFSSWSFPFLKTKTIIC